MSKATELLDELIDEYGVDEVTDAIMELIISKLMEVDDELLH